MTEEKGVWKTVSGRRIFIAKGQSLGDAMAKSGKFKDTTETVDKIADKVSKWTSSVMRKYASSIDPGYVQMKQEATQLYLNNSDDLRTVFGSKDNAITELIGLLDSRYRGKGVTGIKNDVKKYEKEVE